MKGHELDWRFWAQCRAIRVLTGLSATNSGRTIYDAAIAHTAIALRHYDTTRRLRPFLIEDTPTLKSQHP